MSDDVKGKFLKMPQASLGWWAVGLSTLFVVLFVFVSAGFLHFSGFITMTIGVVAGIFTLVVIIWRHERSWLIWLMLLPGLFAIVFAMGEVLVPH